MRRLHAFVNPFSGVAGQSLQIWTQLKVLFSAAHVGIDETMTTHRGHAEEVCGTIDLATVKDGILVVSGDGLFHEVVNGVSCTAQIGKRLPKFPWYHPCRIWKRIGTLYPSGESGASGIGDY